MDGAQAIIDSEQVRHGTAVTAPSAGVRGCGPRLSLETDWQLSVLPSRCQSDLARQHSRHTWATPLYCNLEHALYTCTVDYSAGGVLFSLLLCESYTMARGRPARV